MGFFKRIGAVNLMVTAVFFFSFQAALFSQSTLPPERNAKWHLVKDLSIRIEGPVDSVSITSYGADNTGVVSSNNALQLAISHLKSTGKTGIVLFPSGVFTFTAAIDLPDSIVLKGQGADLTTFRFLTGNAGNNMIAVSGSLEADTTSILGGAPRNAFVCRVRSSSNFNEGDFVQLKQDDASLMFSSWAYGSLGQMLQIKAKRGDSIEFFSPMRINYPATLRPYIQKVQMRKNVGISCVRIVRGNNVTDANQHSNVLFNFAYKCWLNAVVSDSGHFAHVELSNSLQNIISGCYFQNAYDYGGGGRGYGVACQFASSENLVVNNVFRRLRHAMLLQSGSNGNVFSYNYSRQTVWTEALFPSDVSGDIVLHGNYPFCNLFEHNIVQNIVLDNSHGNNGPYNLFFRNRAENVGIYMNNSCGDSTAFMGNEVTRSRSLFYGLYTLTGNGNYQYGNNILGVNQPSGTQQLPDSSYYLSAKPSFMSGGWPSIGYPNTINTGTIDAYGRYFNLPSNPTVCTPPQIVLKEESLFLNVQYTPGFFVFKWVVSEIPAPGEFVIQKSIDGIHFYSLDSMPSGNSSKIYFFQLKGQATDLKHLSYFRIFYVANGAKHLYSNVAIVKNMDHFPSSSMEVYPNPAVSFVTVRFLSDFSGEASLVVFDAGGKEIMHRVFNASIGQNEVLLHLDKLKSGQYFLSVNTNKEIGIKSVQIR